MLLLYENMKKAGNKNVLNTKIKKLPKHLSKFIDEQLANSPYYSSLLNNEKELSIADGHVVDQVRRLREIERIVTAIEEVNNDLPEDKKEFVLLYYHSNEKISLEGVAHKLHIGTTTVKRWKKEYVTLIAIRLGWI